MPYCALAIPMLGKVTDTHKCYDGGNSTHQHYWYMPIGACQATLGAITNIGHYT